MVGFWFSAMANFVKDGDITTPYSDMPVPYVSLYVGFLVFRNGLPPITLV